MPEQLRLDLDVEKAAITMLNAGIEHGARRRATTARAICSSASSIGEEEHADWLEAQLNLIAQVGEANYLSQQIKEDE